jgi:hypothetical protein
MNDVLFDASTVALVTVIFCIYMLPAIIASRLKHPHDNGI